MVAYSFKPQFVDAIVAGDKRQTIRAPRSRHALVGERIQIYAGMRTRDCRKLIPDPVCIGVDEVENDPGYPLHHGYGGLLIVNGIELHGGEMDTYAIGDGFSSSAGMMRWWSVNHGPGRFTGVAIRWERRDG